MVEQKRVLFVCVENACRSQIAEAFARHYGRSSIQAYSAGSKPRGQVDATAMVVMKERGITLKTQTSKGFSDLPDGRWDAVVTMGCGDACPQIAAARRLDWQIPDPARQPLERYRAVRDLIDQAVRQLIDELV